MCIESRDSSVLVRWSVASRQKLSSVWVVELPLALEVDEGGKGIRGMRPSSLYGKTEHDRQYRQGYLSQSLPCGTEVGLLFRVSLRRFEEHAIASRGGIN